MQNHCVSGTIKQMDLLKFMMKVNLDYYLIVVGVIKFVIGLDVLYVKKLVSQIVLIKTLQESELIHIILYLLKKY